jgi:L-arabinose isomerase
VGIEVVTDLTDQLGVELLTIDASSTVRRFTQELRWNQAYHRLARGL